MFGDVTIGEECWIGPGARIRGDYGAIIIGSRSSVEDNCVIHARPEETSRIGDWVTLGHGSIIHNATIEDWVIVGMGGIGSRLAQLAKAFNMRVIATKRNPATAVGPADEVLTPDRLHELLPKADYVVLTCPLTPETTNLINAEALESMQPSAYLVNVARGGCVDEPALLSALRSGQIAGAAIDHFWDEPLPADSPFWDMANVLITPLFLAL